MNILFPSNQKSTIYVGNLPNEVDDQYIHDCFVTFGEIVDVNMPTDSENPNLHKGFAFVEYEMEEDARDAIDNMHLSEIMGRVIKVSIANPVKYKEYKEGPIWEDDNYIKKYILKEETS
jgi:peptidyl-prolyl isomerase E (cyclophilin E)